MELIASQSFRSREQNNWKRWLVCKLKPAVYHRHQLVWRGSLREHSTNSHREALGIQVLRGWLRLCCDRMLCGICLRVCVLMFGEPVGRFYMGYVTHECCSHLVREFHKLYRRVCFCSARITRTRRWRWRRAAMAVASARNTFRMRFVLTHSRHTCPHPGMGPAPLSPPTICAKWFRVAACIVLVQSCLFVNVVNRCWFFARL